MNIDLNLSPLQSFRQRHLLAWALPLLAIALALVVRLGFSIRTDWKEYRSVSRSIEKEQDRRNELAARELSLKRQLDEPENRELLREVQFVNSVIDERQFSFTEMEARVTALLPPEVRLTALSMPDSGGEPLIHVGVEGSSEGPVETFLINLEDSPDFKDTMITGSGFDEKGNGAPVGISCTARYVSGRGEGSLVKAAAKPAESGGIDVKGDSKPGKVSPPRGLTTAPKVKAGLAAARANPGVPVKIESGKPQPAQNGAGLNRVGPALEAKPVPRASNPPGRAPR